MTITITKNVTDDEDDPKRHCKSDDVYAVIINDTAPCRRVSCFIGSKQERRISKAKSRVPNLIIRPNFIY